MGGEYEMCLHGVWETQQLLVCERHNNYWFMKDFLLTSQCLCVKEIPTFNYEIFLNPAHNCKIYVLLSTIFLYNPLYAKDVQDNFIF